MADGVVDGPETVVGGPGTEHPGGTDDRNLVPQLLLALLLFVTALLPRLATAGRLRSIDEQRWMERSERFLDALVNFRWSEASSTLEGVATMPGITTVWIGGAAKLIWSASGSIGIVDTEVGFVSSGAGWALAQGLSAVVSATLIVALWAVARRWLGTMVASVAAVLLATEPFLVAHGAVLHTDSLVTLLGAICLTSWLLATGSVGARLESDRRRKVFGAIAGAALAGALLTKLNAVLFGPFLLIVTFQALRRREGTSGVPPVATADLLRLVGVAAATGLGVIAVAWPALWVDPGGQLEVIRSSAELGGGAHLQFFRGEITWTPGIWFAPFVLAHRATPWLLVAALGGIVASITDRARRNQALVLVAMGAPHVLVHGLATKQIDRYLLVAWPMIALLAGLGAAWLHGRLSDRFDLSAGRLRAAGLSLAGVLLVHALVVAPWSIAWFSPAFGGSQRAETTLLVGWGEGLEIAGTRIEEREGPACDQRRIGTIYPLYASFPCGDVLDFRGYDDLRPGDYLVLYVGERQRTEPADLDALRSRGVLVDEVWIRGIRYAEIIQISGDDPLDGARGGT